MIPIKYDDYGLEVDAP
jgi:hypothetical protein